MFAAFARMAPRDAVPGTQVIARRSARRTVVICVMVLSLLGVLILSIMGMKDVCPGLPFGSGCRQRLGPVRRLQPQHGCLEPGSPLNLYAPGIGASSGPGVPVRAGGPDAADLSSAGRCPTAGR